MMYKNDSPDKHLTTEEAATFLKIKPQTLEVWRSTKRYEIPYVKVGRLVRYRERDLVRWVEMRTKGGF